MTASADAPPLFGVERGLAYVGCCAVAALNARFYIMAGSATSEGLAVAAFRLFNISVLVWFALFAAWSIARQAERGTGAWRAGDRIVLGGTLLASLLPFPLAATAAGFAAPLWLYRSAAPGSVERRTALVLAAIGAQLVFGHLFLLLFGEAVLRADTALVSWAASAESVGNMVTRADGSNVIITSGCSSVHNVSLALLGWVSLVQLLGLRVDRRLLWWGAASLLAMIALNAGRIVTLVWYPEHFAFLHHGTGGAMFGWAGLFVFTLIAGYSAIESVDRQQAALAT